MTIDTAANCPFEEEMCKTREDNIILDSGYISSHDHLDINAPDDERFFLRTRLKCAPLVTQGFEETIQSPDGNWKRYYYGSYAIWRGDDADVISNFTFQTESRDTQYRGFNGTRIQDASYGMS
jgi:hypothetical protein